MRINVTQYYIRQARTLVGKQNHGRIEERCPVALAVKGALGRTGQFSAGVIVGPLVVCIDGKDYRLPTNARTFIYKYDNDDPVKPFSFELKLPKRYEK